MGAVEAKTSVFNNNLFDDRWMDKDSDVQVIVWIKLKLL